MLYEGRRGRGNRASHVDEDRSETVTLAAVLLAELAGRAVAGHPRRRHSVLPQTRHGGRHLERHAGEALGAGVGLGVTLDHDVRGDCDDPQGGLVDGPDRVDVIALGVQLLSEPARGAGTTKLTGHAFSSCCSLASPLRVSNSIANE